jgi:MoaA/NifB/PqqE/SkfB family radical SAM enzyme
VAEEFVTLREAQEILGVSNFTVWQMVKDGRLETFRSDIDRRKKFVRRADLDSIKAIRPIQVEDAKKAAA